jgi:hypothetical protein
MKKLALFGRVYNCNMKTLNQMLLIFVSSPLLWIGTAGALVSFSTGILLWSGDLNAMARLADALYISTYVSSFLALTFVAGICLCVNGIILGIFRLCRN